MTTVYFIRHAQADNSVRDGRVRPLTEKGMTDRALVTSFLQDKGIDAVLSSLYKRAVDTVADFAERNGFEIELVEDFRERKSDSDWLRDTDFWPFIERQWADFSYSLSDGERLAEVQERNIAALNAALTKYKGKNIVIGTHGTALSTIINYYDPTYGYADFMEMVDLLPCVVRMDFSDDGCVGMVKIDLFHPDRAPDYDKCIARTAELGTLKAYRFTVIFARYQDKWLYSRHKDRDTYETAGGHIEPGETPLECAKRELYEETGATKFFIHPAFDYSVHTNTEFSYGQAFYADIKTLVEIPQDSEMVEVCGLHTIPDKMTYPAILPVLYSKMRKWLGLDKAEKEYWDILDENRNPTGRTHKRGDIMQPGDFHLVVNAWIVNSRGEFLITRRAFNKIGFPGMWEIPSGSATAGEDSLAAVIREAGEECGIGLLPENAELFSTYRRSRGAFHDNWLFRQDFELSEVVLQEGETIDARAATWDEISAMMERGEFIEREVFPAFDLLEGMS